MYNKQGANAKGSSIAVNAAPYSTVVINDAHGRIDDLEIKVLLRKIELSIIDDRFSVAQSLMESGQQSLGNFQWCNILRIAIRLGGNSPRKLRPELLRKMIDKLDFGKIMQNDIDIVSALMIGVINIDGLKPRGLKMYKHCDENFYFSMENHNINFQKIWILRKINASSSLKSQLIYKDAFYYSGEHCKRYEAVLRGG